jgi:hypothetical protein
MQQESNFTGIPLDQVIAELERQYDIKSDGVDTTKLFTGSFTHSNQKIAVESVTIPKLGYKIEGKTILLITMNRWILYLLLTGTFVQAQTQAIKPL